MQNGDSSKKISKIRTFQSDISSVRPTVNQPTSMDKDVIEETPFNTQKLSEQTIFKPVAPSTTPAIEPKILDEKIIEEKTSSSTPIPEVIPPENLSKDPNIAETPKLGSTTPISNPLTKAIPKETLASIVNTDVSHVISDDTSSEGSIITDQKRTRFSLTSSIIEAVKAWFSNEKESFKDRAETRRKAIPTVSPVKNRKEVLQKAAEQSAMAPKDDHQQLTTKFAALPKTKVPQNDKPVQIKKKVAPAKPSWSHFTGAEKESDLKEEAPLPTINTPPKTPEPIKTVLPSAPIKQNSAGLMPALTTPEVFKEKAPVPATTTSSVSISSKSTDSKPPEIKLVGNKKRANFAWLGKFLTYSGIAVVIVIAVTSGVGLVWWFFSNSSQKPTVNLVEENIQSVQPELVTYEQNVPITLPLRKEELWQDILNTKTSSSSGLVLLLLLNDDNTPATTSEILEKINWPSNSAFLKNIEEVNFGLYNGVPFMVIKTTNFDTVFGGLLASESTLSEDLSLFISSSTETLSVNFTDELVQNHDIRVLKSESGRDALVYGFINRNTIVITSDRETFSEVANQIR